ncbi:MAG: hypothetical protein NC037_01015 [Bacteroides sp.]|nr:hypothetical protein [Bacillota bacterium]MCM1393503.1 hypothetical protein [[Eubacterium] siraeum]MCM1455096.1 hypothetical protein [Bacteroides sp.]
MTIANLIVLILNCITLVNTIILNVLLIRNIKRKSNTDTENNAVPDDDEDLCD